jgi:shikimate 5-dehydrogenase
MLLAVSAVMWRAARRQARIATLQRASAEQAARLADRQRLAAQSSEKKANDARDQADALINFMLTDLGNKLKPGDWISSTMLLTASKNIWMIFRTNW